MAEKESKTIESELIENIDNVKTITIEAKDGKEYKLTNKLPVKAARLLGIPEATLRFKIKKYAISKEI